MLLAVPMATRMFSEVDILLRLYVTILCMQLQRPLLRDHLLHFVMLKLMYLRSTVTEKKTFNILLLQLHHEFCDEFE